MTDSDRTPTGHRPDTDTPQPDASELVEVLKSQVEDLRQQLATRTEELHRRDELLAMALSRIPQLAPSAEHQDVTEQDPTSSRGHWWWPW